MRRHDRKQGTDRPPADRQQRPVRSRPTMPRQTRRPAAPTSWDPLATWYNGWMGEHGSEHHREVAVPALMRLLRPQPDESILDVGCGQGVLVGPLVRAGARYTGVDASPRLLALARRHHRQEGRFVLGDARALARLPELEGKAFDAVVFLLSLQDMDPLERVLAEAARVLRRTGRLVLLLTHPAFRIPRQSGWGWDPGRKLVYRRVDRYLTPLPVPLSPLGGKGAGTVTRSFHRPIGAYINALADAGLRVDRMEEIPAHTLHVEGSNARADSHARKEIPLFLALRAQPVDTPPA